MCSEHFNQASYWTETIENVNLGFLIIFTIEMLVKVVGLNPKGYIASPWNIFDGLLVIGSWGMSPLSEQSVVMIARVFRIGRVFRVVKKFKGLRLLFKTLMFSLPAIFNVFLLWIRYK